MYRSLARWCTHRPWHVVGLWLALMIGVNIAGGVVGAAFDSAFSSPESESSRGFETIEKYFPGAASEYGGSIVFENPTGVRSPEVVDAMNKMFRAADAIDGVTIVSPFDEFGAQQIAPNNNIAFARVNLDPSLDSTETAAIGADITKLIPTVDGLRVEIGGTALAPFATPKTELIGVAFAIIVLIVAFGSVLAMGLPIGIALAGVATGGIGVVTLLTHVMTVPDFAPFIGIMIGLGIGIDYALFIVTRYRELAKRGVDHLEAIEESMDTAGRAVVVAGITVVVSLLGMLLIGMAFISGLGVVAAATVAVTVVASITLLPALLALVHTRLETTRWRGLIIAAFVAIALLGVGLGIPAIGAAGAGTAAAVLLASFAVRPLRDIVPARRDRPIRETAAYRWSRQIQARPTMWAVFGAGLLIALTVPAFALRMGFSDESNRPKESTTRQAYDLIADGFGKGFNGPLVLAVEAGQSSDRDSVTATVDRLAEIARKDPGVAKVAPPFPNDPAVPTAYLLQIIPTSGPQDEETAQTVARLRSSFASVLPATQSSDMTAQLTGAVPANIDISNFLARRIVIFVGVVLAVSFLLLAMAFRSLLVPLKAVIMNMLSISAAYGVIVAIFQWGWLGGLTGIEPAPIEPFIPMMLFAIVFGLSMDYEVFLLTRIKEEYDRTGDARESVADGLAATAKVITAAAAIMVVVFGSFLLEEDRITKLFGSGLALAVLLDATLVRMLLVPATMELLGSRNWWMPHWLDRILPKLNIEGPTHSPSPGANSAAVPASHRVA
jgi:putative drug exporter of the RND superfamily